MGRQDWDESGSDNGQLQARFNDVLDAYDDHRAALATAHRKLAEMRAEAVSADRTVRVTVDSSGAVLEIALQPAALRTTAESLASTLTAIAQAAAQQAKCSAPTSSRHWVRSPTGWPSLPNWCPGCRAYAPSRRTTRRHNDFRGWRELAVGRPGGIAGGGGAPRRVRRSGRADSRAAQRRDGAGGRLLGYRRTGGAVREDLCIGRRTGYRGLRASRESAQPG